MSAYTRKGRFARILEESSIIRHFLWKYRRFVGVGLVALFLVDLLEMVPPLLLKRSVDVVTSGEFTREQAMRELLLASGIYVCTAILQGIGRYGWRMYLIRASLFSGRDMRQGFARHLFGLSPSFFDKRPVGELMSLATNDVEAVRMAIGAGLLTFADMLFYFLTVPIAMFVLSPELTLIAFLPLPIIPWLVMRKEREVNTRFEAVQGSFAKLSAMAQESIAGIRVLKSFAKEDAQIQRFAAEGERFAKLNLSLARVQTSLGPTLDFAMSLGLVLLLFVGGRILVGPDTTGLGVGTISLGTFVAFQRFIQKMVWPMTALGMSISYYQRAASSSNRLKEVYSNKTDVPEASVTTIPTLVHGRTKGQVEFSNLTFSYPGSAQVILKNLSLKIESGERVAFLGAVGSGKSALLSLLPRLYPVAHGMVRIDGVDINDWPLEELRRQVGFVSQDVFLFSETVTENVAFGLQQWVEGQSATLPVEEATQLAAVHEDVMGLTGSYRTRLGERGVNLSGGQKQRLTIARAIAKAPSILVLDDALSSVDVRTEEMILRGLRARPERNTEIIAAHRISTIKDADRIAVLEEGTIRQLGTHQELIADRRGLYRKYYEQQRLKEDLESYAQSLDEQGGDRVIRP